MGRDGRDGRAELRPRAAGGDPRPHARRRAHGSTGATTACCGSAPASHTRARSPSSATRCPGWRSPRARSARRRSATAGRSAATSAPPPPPATRCRRCTRRGAEVEVASTRGTRSIPIEDFITGPKRNVLAPDELIAAFRIARRQGRPAVLQDRHPQRDGDRGLLVRAGDRRGGAHGRHVPRLGGAHPTPRARGRDVHRGQRSTGTRAAPIDDGGARGGSASSSRMPRRRSTTSAAARPTAATRWPSWRAGR